MIFRAVKSNSGDEVIAIAEDSGQGGDDYHGMGTWCNFTFTSIPQEAGEPHTDWHHEVSGSSIIAVVNA